MVKRFYKHKLLLDENMPQRQYFPVLNQHFDVKHIAADFRKSGLPDPQVYDLARSEHRLLITYNHKDFRDLALRSKDTGVIGVSPNMSLAHIDNKLTALLTKATENELYGMFIVLSEET